MDDDDEWKPESITWKDGTKSTIPNMEEAATPSLKSTPDTTPAAVSKQNGVQGTSRSPVSGALPTVKPTVLGSGRSLVLKGVPEKPTLVQKPPAPPTPVKSPWAPLPKVDRASVVANDPLLAPRSAAKDAADSRLATAPAPKEMAADDFSRNSWRDGPSTTNKELFNSQSGRYEPFSDRRGGMRNEHSQGRQPAVLQRPTPPDHQGPAEPSPAFQQHRHTEQHAPWQRRRTSSNVSGGSGSYLPRLKGHEQSPLPETSAMRPASINGSSEVAASPMTVAIQLNAASTQSPRPLPAVISADSTQAVPHRPSEGEQGPAVQAPQQPASTTMDPNFQKEYMVRAREAAMQRRKEKEAQEEAAKKERLRLKLKALEDAAESEAKPAEKGLELQHAAQLHHKAPPQPRGSGSAPSALTTDESEPALLSRKDPYLRKPSSASHGQERRGAAVQPPRNGTKPHAVGKDGKSPDSRPNGPSSVPSDETVDGRTHAHPWSSDTKANETLQPGGWGAQSGIRNVWGSPNNNRSLGNGTFASDIVPTQGTSGSLSGPGPIAPPSSARTGPTVQSNVSDSSATRPAPIAPPKPGPRAPQAVGGNVMSSVERQVMQNKWSAAVRQKDEEFNKTRNAQFEERDRRLKADGKTLKDLQPAVNVNWRETPLDADGRRQKSTTKAQASDQQASMWGPSAPGLKASVGPPSETAQPVPMESSAQRPQISLPQGDGSKTLRQDNVPTSILGASATTGQTRTGSRFFPARDVRLEQQSSESPRPKSLSPPPPDMVGHPAFDGDSTHPQVTLPRSRPVVRLPPAPEPEAALLRRTAATDSGWGTCAPHEHASASSWGPVGQLPGSGHGHHSQGNAWQARFDDLLGGQRRVPPPSKLPSSDQTAHTCLGPRPFAGVTTSDTTSKVMAEECFEEQEMGSLPTVRVPKRAPDLLWVPAPAPLPRYGLHKKLQVVGTSVESFSLFGTPFSANAIRISIPGQANAKMVNLPFPRNRSNPRREGRGSSRGGNGRHAPNSHRGGNPSNANTGVRDGRGGIRTRDVPHNWTRTGTSSTAAIQT